MEDFLNQLMAALCGGHPQGLLFGGLMLLLAQRFFPNLPIKLPSLPQPGPQPTPAPIPLPPPQPALPILIPNPDGTPKYPALRKLLDLLLAGLSFADVPAAHVAAAEGELATLREEKMEKHRAELAALENRQAKVAAPRI